MSGEHAILAPSASPQWGHCSGSVAPNASAPDLETPEKREGTAAHWVVAEVLTNFKIPGMGTLLCSEYIGAVAPNGVIIDSKMAEGAQICVDDVIETAQPLGAVKHLMIEHRVAMPAVHPENWGTLDVAIAWHLNNGTIYLWDYKHGHRENSAIENLQLIEYAEGLREAYQIDGHAAQHTNVVMRVVQPFCYHALGPVSEWVVKLSDLRPYLNTLHAKAHEALTDPKLTSGRHCRDCAAVGTCSAARLAAYNLIDVADRPYIMDDMTGADLAVERQLLKDGLAATKARFEAIEDELVQRVTKGETDSGLTVESSKGRLAYTVPVTEAIAFASQFGVDAAVPGVLTPTQTKAAVPAALRPHFEKVLSTIAHRPAGKLKLVTATESRTAQAFKPKRST